MACGADNRAKPRASALLRTKPSLSCSLFYQWLDSKALGIAVALFREPFMDLTCPP